MIRTILLLAVLLGSTAAWGIDPCCNVSAVDAKTGLVSVKNIKTGKILRYQAEPVGVRSLKVGDTVDLVNGQLLTAAGARIAGRIQP